jgi:hypothetical protein
MLVFRSFRGHFSCRLQTECHTIFLTTRSLKLSSSSSVLPSMWWLISYHRLFLNHVFASHCTLSRSSVLPVTSFPSTCLPLLYQYKSFLNPHWHLYREDGNWNVCRNVGKPLKFDSTYPRRYILCICVAVYLRRLPLEYDNIRVVRILTYRLAWAMVVSWHRVLPLFQLWRARQSVPAVPRWVPVHTRAVAS